MREMFTLKSVASEINQHCRGEARPEGPKLETRRAEPGWGSWGGMGFLGMDGPTNEGPGAL